MGTLHCTLENGAYLYVKTSVRRYDTIALGLLKKEEEEERRMSNSVFLLRVEGLNSWGDALCVSLETTPANFCLRLCVCIVIQDHTHVCHTSHNYCCENFVA